MTWKNDNTTADMPSVDEMQRTLESIVKQSKPEFNSLVISRKTLEAFLNEAGAERGAAVGMPPLGSLPVFIEDCPAKRVGKVLGGHAPSPALLELSDGQLAVVDPERLRRLAEGPIL